jgi:predicted transcriptional regulator
MILPNKRRETKMKSRKKKILEMEGQEMTVQELAKEANVTESRVYQIAKKLTFFGFLSQVSIFLFVK